MYIRPEAKLCTGSIHTYSRDVLDIADQGNHGPSTKGCGWVGMHKRGRGAVSGGGARGRRGIAGRNVTRDQYKLRTRL